MRRPDLVLIVSVLVIALGLGGFAYAKDKDTHAHSGEKSDYTLIQVMQHLSSSQQQIQAGLLMNNRLMIQKGAMAIGHHPMPKGGIKPYIKKNHAALKGTIKVMDRQVHDSADPPRDSPRDKGRVRSQWRSQKSR